MPSPVYPNRISQIDTTSPITGGPITDSGNVALNVAVDHAFTAAQTVIVEDTTNNAIITPLTLGHNTTGTPANLMGTCLVFLCEDSTTANSNVGEVACAWSNVTHASHASFMDLKVARSGLGPTTAVRIFGSGGLSVNNLTDPGAGIINLNSGLRIANTAPAGKVLIGDGTNYLESVPAYPNAASNVGKLIQSDGTNFATSTMAWPTGSAPASGKILVSDGTNMVASTPTFPNASAVSGKFIRSDGTNWIASTPTLPATAGAAGKILRTDGTNYVESTPTFPNAAGSSGVLLSSDGTNFVTTTPTFPTAASPISRKKIVSDGTNWVASTETWAVPGTSGNTLISDGTNWTSTTDTGGWTRKFVSGSAATTTGQSLVDITGLNSGTILNATKYEVQVYMDCLTSTGTAGVMYGVHCDGSGSAGVVSVFLVGSSTSNTIVASERLNAPDTNSVARMTSASATGTFYLSGFVTTKSTGAASISIQHLKVTSGTSTVQVGSSFAFRVAGT